MSQLTQMKKHSCRRYPRPAPESATRAPYGNRHNSYEIVFGKTVEDAMLTKGHSPEEPKLSCGKRIKKFMRFLGSDKSTRNLTCFLTINLLFGFVELVYGLSTNSLGLISDAFHMFFDCTGLVLGLVASLVARWRPNEKYSYGYGRAEVLGCFVNCLLLIFVAFFILAESVERSFEPPEIKHERLLVVSLLGLVVNLIGIFVFRHGGEASHHGHHHHGHSHHHVDLETVSSDGDQHGRSASQTSRSLIKEGVLLHILADTLGSVGVIISSILIENFGWVRSDVVCSVVIAFLILASVYPLVKECFYVLMQRQPDVLTEDLRVSYRRLTFLPGVYRVDETHFWTLHSNKYIGTVTLEVSRTSDLVKVLNEAEKIFSSIGIHHVNVQFKFTSI